MDGFRVYTTNPMQCDHSECGLTECFGPCFYITLVINSPQANLNIRRKQNKMQETDRNTEAKADGQRDTWDGNVKKNKA